MDTVTSKDGTAIAFDLLGDGPPVILVSGGSVDRIVERRAGGGPREGLHGLQLRPPRQGPERRHAALRGPARDRGHRGCHRRGRRLGPPLRTRHRAQRSRSRRPPAGCRSRSLRSGRRRTSSTRTRDPTGRHGVDLPGLRGEGRSRRRGRVLHGEGRRDAAGVRRRSPIPAVVGVDRGTRPHPRLRRRDHGATTRCRSRRPRR